MILACAATAFAGNAAPARATKEEAFAFVKKTIEYFKHNGSEKAFAEFNNPKGKFIDRDLFIVIYDSTGLCFAHGYNPKLVGRNRMDEEDADGHLFVKERMELMKTQTSFWSRFLSPDPMTHKLTPKAVYCEVADDPVLKQLLFCSGAYENQP